MKGFYKDKRLVDIMGRKLKGKWGDSEEDTLERRECRKPRPGVGKTTFTIHCPSEDEGTENSIQLPSQSSK